MSTTPSNVTSSTDATGGKSTKDLASAKRQAAKDDREIQKGMDKAARSVRTGR